MTTPEQQAREMHGMVLMAAAQAASGSNMLANLIAERDALKAELDAIKGAREPYCYVYEWFVSPGVWHRSLSPDKYNGRDCDSFIGLYARPATPLTYKKLSELARDAQIAYCLDKHSSFDIAFARAIEAAHNIKEAKP